MIKPIYKNRIKTFSKEYIKFKQFTIKQYDIFQQYTNIIFDIQKEIKNISIDSNIEPNKKFILINEKLEHIETISNDISKIKSLVEKKQEEIKKQELLLLETCLKEQKELTTEDIYNEIKKYTNDF